MSHAVNVLGFKRIEGFLRPKQNCATFIFRKQVHPFLIWHWLSQNFELFWELQLRQMFWKKSMDGTNTIADVGMSIECDSSF